MKIFVVESGCRYEGGSAEGAFTSLDSAMELVNRKLKQHADELAEWRKVDAWWEPPDFDFKPHASIPYRWENDSDYIIIREFEAPSDNGADNQ